MSFYHSIAKYYRDIFPLQPVQAHFVRESITDPAKSALLDVGCGTGDLSRELADSFSKVTGIDLDTAMLDFARESAPANLEFFILDMLTIQKRFGEGAFNGVLCFGNTLVHLNAPESIFAFIQQARMVLGSTGKLLLQLISYDRILDQGIQALPTIETEHYSFVRNYQYDKESHLVNFESILTIKSRAESIRNRIPLYPLRQAELRSMLSEAGFSSISCYGNFKKDALKKNSIPLVVEASI